MHANKTVGESGQISVGKALAGVGFILMHARCVRDENLGDELGFPAGACESASNVTGPTGHCWTKIGGSTRAGFSVTIAKNPDCLR